MDNKLERALSSMTDLKKVLRNNVPRLGRRKSSSASPAALSSIDKAVTDEEANAIIAKIPHSPSIPVQLKDQDANANNTVSDNTGNSPGSGFHSYLGNYFGQSYKQAAMSELLGRRDVEGKATVPTPILDIHGAHGISLSTLNELARLAQKPLEADEQWDWQEVFTQASTLSLGSRVRQSELKYRESERPDQKFLSPSGGVQEVELTGEKNIVHEIDSVTSVAEKNPSSRFSFPSHLVSRA